MYNSLRKFRNAVAAIALAVPLAAAAQEPSVVLVHGAFSDGSAWNRVIPILQDAGVTVSAAQLNLASLEQDAATVTRLVDLQTGPVILVGHSYGGTVITEAGAHEKVDQLVFIAGFAPDVGQSLSDLSEGQPPAPWQAELFADSAGFLRLTANGMSQFFAPDLTIAETALMAATQGPLNYDTSHDAPTVAAWSMKPTSYIIAQNDQILSPRVQGYFAQKMEARITMIPSSHAAMLAQPKAVAEVILQAVEAAETSD